MLAPRAGLYALGIVASVALGAGGARLLWPQRAVDRAQEGLEGATAVDPGTAPEVDVDAAPTPAADVAVDDEAPVVPEPPPDRAEAPGAPPTEHHEWLKGYWRWDEERATYAWVAGFWCDRLVAAPYAPPRPRREVISRAPGAGFVYLPGYWRWGGRGYVWASGHWAHGRAGYVYVGPHWTKVNGRWTWRTPAWVAGEIASARPERDLAREHREHEEAHAAQVREERVRQEEAARERAKEREEREAQEAEASASRERAKQAREARRVEARAEAEARANEAHELEEQVTAARRAEAREEAERQAHVRATAAAREHVGEHEAFKKADEHPAPKPRVATKSSKSG